MSVNNNANDSRNKKPIRKNRSYELREYDPKWADIFEELKTTLSSIYSGLAVDIQHIGSTSIPGMLAKPTIDVLVLTNDMSKVRKLYPIFQEHGYICWGDLVAENEEYFTYDNEQGERLYNVHTMQAGSEHAKSVITFRDYMRTHRDEAENYMAIKLKLLDAYGNDDYFSYNSEKAVLMQKLKDDSWTWAKSVRHRALL